MAYWRCNAEEPGSYLQGRGIVAPGREFYTPDDPEDPYFERAREKWIPLDGAAKSLVEKAKEDAKKANEESARLAAERKQAEEDARNGISRREFKTREEQQPGVAANQRFRQGEPRPTEEEQARDQAWRDEHERQVSENLTPEQRASRAEAVRAYERDRQARASGGHPPDAGLNPPQDADVQPRRPQGAEPSLAVGQTGPHPITGTSQEGVQAERDRQQQTAQKQAIDAGKAKK